MCGVALKIRQNRIRQGSTQTARRMRGHHRVVRKKKMAVYRKKQPARRPVRRGWKRHARTGMFLFAFALVAVTVGVILPHAGVMSAAAEGSTLTEKIFTTVQSKNLPVIAIDPGHGGTDPGSGAAACGSTR